jgi:hypothetical protein
MDSRENSGSAHDGCGGRAGRAELLTGIDGSSRPVRRIVLRDGGYDRGDL